MPEDRSPQSVLRYIASLAHRTDYFDALEKALKENADVLVGGLMSMPDWTKSLVNLREANMAERRSSGTDVADPLAEIQKFLNPEKVQ